MFSVHFLYAVEITFYSITFDDSQSIRMGNLATGYLKIHATRQTQDGYTIKESESIVEVRHTFQ